MEALLVLLAVAYLCAPIAAFIIALGSRQRIGALEARLAALDQRLATTTPAAQAPVTGPTPPLSPLIAPTAAPPPAAVAEPKPASPIAPPPSRPSRPTEGFEQSFGTRWVVWIGGVALALGGIFLVSFAVEQGFFGPGMRVALAAILAVALISAGEWSRRSEVMSGFIGLPSAHVPSILTAAGTTVGFATVYAAYALYDFVGPGAAFLLLGAVALATLAAALLHGPWLAGLGLIGAELTPLLIATARPNDWALYLYLAVVTAASFALARARLWRWLAVTAVACGVFWGFADIASTAVAAHVTHDVIGFGLVAALIVSGFMYGPNSANRVEAISSGALAAYLLPAAALVVVQRHDTAAVVAFSGLAGATLLVAWRAVAAAAAVPAAALLTFLVLLTWVLQRDLTTLIAPAGPLAGTVPEPVTVDPTGPMLFGIVFAVLFGGLGFFAQGRQRQALASILWAATSTATPIAILIALYYRIAQFERSIPFAALALLLAALFAVATEALNRRAPRAAAAQAIYATGCVVALALAFTLALERGWLTVGLALMVPGIAWVANKRPLPMLRWLAAAVVILVLARVGWEPRIVGADIGATPIFNWLLYGYGGPAAAFWCGGRWLRQRADDVPTRIVEAAAILFTVLLAVLEIRHVVNAGDIYHVSASLDELALQVCVGLAMTIGLEHLRGRTGSVVHDIGALTLAALTLAAIALGLLLIDNPLLTGRDVGGPWLNLILLGYGLPSVLAIVLALRTRATRPQPYRIGAAVTAVVLALVYLSLQVTRLYHGPVLTAGPFSNAEQYTYSAVWLAFGLVLLLVGLLLPSKPARLASAAVILLTIAKVFLVDMADLTGIWRALSFIVLGLVLVGIGLLYQRLLFPARNGAAAGIV